MPKALDLKAIVKKIAEDWDGGFVFGGMVGYGDAFVIRDRHGIRPAYYYCDDEVLVVASERPVIQTVFNVPFEEVTELPAGHIILSRYSGEVEISPCLEPVERQIAGRWKYLLAWSRLKGRRLVRSSISISPGEPMPGFTRSARSWGLCWCRPFWRR